MVVPDTYTLLTHDSHGKAWSLTNAELLEAFRLGLVLQSVRKHDDICRYLLAAGEHNAALKHLLDLIHLACHLACPCKFEDAIIGLSCMAAINLKWQLPDESVYTLW